MKYILRISFLCMLSLWLSGCHSTNIVPGARKVMAVESFLADITQNIAGDRLTVDFLVPYGVDPHEFEPTPKDMAAVAESNLLIVNGGGIEGWLAEGLKNVGGSQIVVTASAGLPSRPTEGASSSAPATVDPHFWMDPVLVKTYVANIVQGLIQLDPSGEAEYSNNAQIYSAKLDDLDGWVRSQVEQIPVGQRLLVTDHEDLGYFSDRYGFTIIGTLYPGTSPDAEPSASQFAELVQNVRSSGAKAVFLDVDSNTQLADQLSQETGIRVFADLYIHSLTPSGGAAPTYLTMIQYDVNTIVSALL
jgi:zinc/manganese transport system substrate-binding protein